MIVEPTIDFDKAATEPWDVVVVGAGPAGAMASRELSRLGASVLLVDKSSFPRFKVCGSCLSPRCLQSLQNVGLGDLPARLGARTLKHWFLAAGGRRAELKLAGHVSLSREAFDAALIGASVAAGTAFLSGTRAELGAVDGGALQLTVRDSERRAKLNARVIVDASGLGGNLQGTDAEQTRRPASTRIGAAVLADVKVRSYEQSAIYMSCGSHGYVGAVSVEDDRLDVAAALDPGAVKQFGLGRTAERVIAEAGLPPIPGLAELPWRGTPLLTRRADRLAAERIFAIGDAAGYLEPFTGEGIAWALSAGAAVAPIACEAGRDWNEALCTRWSREYRRVVLRRQWICRGAAALLRCPRLTRTVVGLLACAPCFAGPIIHAVSAPRIGRRISFSWLPRRTRP